MEQYADCAGCGQQMEPGVACTLEQYSGEVLDRVPFILDDYDGNCRDCNAPVGGLHHPGCAVEICPDCLGQLISCGCNEPDLDTF